MKKHLRSLLFGLAIVALVAKVSTLPILENKKTINDHLYKVAEKNEEPNDSSGPGGTTPPPVGKEFAGPGGTTPPPVGGPEIQGGESGPGGTTPPPVGKELAGPGGTTPPPVGTPETQGYQSGPGGTTPPPVG